MCQLYGDKSGKKYNLFLSNFIIFVEKIPFLSLQWPHVANSYCIEGGRYRVFPPSQKVLSDSVVTEKGRIEKWNKNSARREPFGRLCTRNEPRQCSTVAGKKHEFYSSFSLLETVQFKQMD